MRNLRIFDPAAWFALAFISLLTLLSVENSGSLSFSFIWQPFIWGIGILLLSLSASKLREYFPRFADLLFSLLLSFFLYKTWPHTFFDDAGFIMRYLDNLKDGVWFHYNAAEGPVFGISGFIHGLITSVFVKFFFMTPERALHVSNLVGLAGCVWFLSGTFRKLIQNTTLGYAMAAITVLFSKSFCDVLFTGMETPLHIAFILGALYFLVHENSRGFYLFSSLSIISKLDAVPVIGFLMLIYAFGRFRKVNVFQLSHEELKPKTFFFILPLLLWILFAFVYFGSPFPQSAKAKVLYHSGAQSSWFPFLEGFTNDIYKFPLLVMLVLFFFIHTAFAIKSKGRSITLQFAFGWMFVGIMLLYYFYNPNERMLWYYALPDFLLVAQCVYSSVWITSKAKDWKKIFLPLLLIPFWIMYIKPDADGARNWMFSYLEKVEQERYKVGHYIAQKATPEDTLIAWHGLLARPFPGFVIDGTGLNSKLAVDFMLNRDSMLSVLKPDFGIHHGYAHINTSFSEQGYFVKGIFGDVTLENWPAWIWWEQSKNPSLRFTTLLITDSMVQSGKITNPSNPLKVEGKIIEYTIPIQKNKSSSIWFAFEGRSMNNRDIRVLIWRSDTIWKEISVSIPAYGVDSYPSLYTFGDKISLSSPKDSLSDMFLKVQFLPTGEDTSVKINNALIEYQEVTSP